MNSIAQSTYPVTSAQLAEEMKHVDINEVTPWGGFTIITGVHFRDSPRPVAIIKGGPMDLILLSGGD